MAAHKKLVSVFAKRIVRFNNPDECLRYIVSAYTEYQKIAQEEQTKRRDIEAWEKTTIAKIEAQRDSIIHYLERSF